MSDKTFVKYMKIGLIGMLKNSLFKLIFIFFLSTETFSSEHVVKGVGMEWKPSVTFAKTGDRILDTHLGGGAIAIACDILGFDLEGYEISSLYYTRACKRLEEHQKQIRLF